MRAVINKGRGGAEVMSVEETDRPRPGANQVLVRVRAAALNYADTMQRRGEYEVPAGQTEIMGVEIAGVVEEWGADVAGFFQGRRVFGLVEGGGYAEYCLMEQQLAMDIPGKWSFVEAAAIPEAFYAANETIFVLGNLEAGQSILIHAGGSGVGSAAIQMARQAGATVFCTVGSEEKAQKARQLGADAAINYKRDDFVRRIRELTGDKGVDVVEDFVGGSYFNRNLSIIKPGGCLLLVGVLDGYTGEVDFRQVILQRLQIKGTAIRNRSLAEKEKVRQRFQQRWLPLLIDGTLKPVIHSVYPLEEVTEAHREMEAARNFGKIILTLD